MKKYFIIIVILINITNMLYGNDFKNRADRYWNSGIRHYNNKNYKDALSDLKKSAKSELKQKNYRIKDLIDQFDKIGEIYLKINNIDKSLYYYNLMLKVAKKNHVNTSIIKAYNSIGEVKLKQREYILANDYFKKSLTILKHSIDKNSIVYTLNKIAYVNKLMRKFNLSLTYYKRALKETRLLNIDENESAILSNIGTLYYFKREYKKANLFFTNALNIEIRKKREIFQAVELGNIGSVYRSMGLYDKSIVSFRRAIELDEKNGNFNGKAIRLNNLGRVYYIIGENNKAVNSLENAYKINLKLNNIRLSAVILSNIGEIYDSMEKKEKALKYYMRALFLDKRLNQNNLIKDSFSNIGKIYAKRERYGDAIDFFNRAIRVKNRKKMILSGDYFNIGKVLIDLNRYDEAVKYLKKALSIDKRGKVDSLIAGDFFYIGICYFNLSKFSNADYNFYRSISFFKKSSNRFKERNIILDDVYSYLIHSLVKQEKNSLAIVETFKKKNLLYNLKKQIPLSKEFIENIILRLGKDKVIVVYESLGENKMIRFKLENKIIKSKILNQKRFIKSVSNHFGEKSFLQILNNIKIKRKNIKGFQFDFKDLVNYRSFLQSKRALDEKDNNNLKKMSSLLFKFLFYEISIRSYSNKEIIIIPDKTISRISFDSLVMDDDRFLIEKYIISYAFSMKDNFYSNDYAMGGINNLSILKNKINIKKIYRMNFKTDKFSKNKFIIVGRWEIEDFAKQLILKNVNALLRNNKINISKAFAIVKRKLIFGDIIAESDNISKDKIKLMSLPFYWSSFSIFK